MVPAITRVELHEHPVQGDLAFDLGGRRHLILTGPNGSGKTTILEAIVSAAHHGAPSRGSIRSTLDHLYELVARDDNPRTWADIRQLEAEFASQRATLTWTGTALEHAAAAAKGFFLAYMPVARGSLGGAPPGPQRIERTVAELGKANAAFRTSFLQLLVNRHTSLLLAKAEGDPAWRPLQDELDRLRDGLRQLFLADDLELRFDRATFAVHLVVGGAVQPWERLAAGHESALNLVGELFVRTHGVEGRAPGAGGVAVIDEPDLHLHPEMQETVMPALVTLFPEVQFVLATHAAPVVSSIPDAWVFDLRTRTGIASDELAGHPYGALLRAHFGVPTDYDERTAHQVDALLARVPSALTADAKRALRDELAGFLRTQDPRVRDAWLRLGLDAGAA